MFDSLVFRARDRGMTELYGRYRCRLLRVRTSLNGPAQEHFPLRAAQPASQKNEPERDEQQRGPDANGV